MHKLKKFKEKFEKSGAINYFSKTQTREQITVIVETQEFEFIGHHRRYEIKPLVDFVCITASICLNTSYT